MFDTNKKNPFASLSDDPISEHTPYIKSPGSVLPPSKGSIEEILREIGSFNPASSPNATERITKLTGSLNLSGLESMLAVLGMVDLMLTADDEHTELIQAGATSEDMRSAEAFLFSRAVSAMFKARMDARALNRSMDQVDLAEIHPDHQEDANIPEGFRAVHGPLAMVLDLREFTRIIAERAEEMIDSILRSEKGRQTRLGVSRRQPTSSDTDTDSDC